MSSTVARMAGNIAAGLVGSPGFMYPSRFGSTQPEADAAVIDVSTRLALGIMKRVREELEHDNPPVDLARKVDDAFALGRIAKAVGIPGPEYDGMTIRELADAVERKVLP